ncbi:HD-GYP domain-containing protein [Salidesulfovibrio onnuriiensis]|uniref:HD-GYP domain-containing protein n=1 Tax=Salidesulfovibrio onnuriiensis TaxID=2583823 RepID=UPI0011C80B4F|nr:HD domain-containing phosphohydrolase [Salidesulfovibrio onnuriiensis]
MSELYIPVPTRIILPNTKANFVTYLKQDDTYVLYSISGEQFSPEHQLRLELQDITTLYVSREEEEELNAYVERHIARVLADSSIPIHARAEAWTRSASSVGRDLFEKKLPPSMLKKHYDRFEKFITESASIFKSPEGLRELSKLIADGYDIYHHGLGTTVLTASVLLSFEGGEDLLAECGAGAMLHDYGKLKLDPELLKMDPTLMKYGEKQKWDTHPILGVQACAGIPLPPEGIHCVLFHHEREDGKGFPGRLKGEDMPFYARIVSLCDHYDRLTRKQHYRSAYTPFEALKAIRDDKGLYNRDAFMRLVNVLSDANIADL